jgi:hypothetical protein
LASVEFGVLRQLVEGLFAGVQEIEDADALMPQFAEWALSFHDYL